MTEYKDMSDAEKKKEDWMNSKWRPMMGWMYMVVCMMDMVIFPILWSLLQTLTHSPITQWNPLTLQGAGLFHIAMGAVLGIAAFGRTQEKLNGATMVAHNQWQQVTLQHLALLRQHQAVSQQRLRQVSEHQAPQVALAEAALEAYLSQQHLGHQLHR